MKKVSIIALIWAHIQVKLCNGLTYISSPVEKAMSKIQSAAYVIRSRAKATIARRNIEVESIEFTLTGNGSNYSWSGNQNIAVGNWSGGNITAGTGLTIGNLLPTNNMISFNNKDNRAVLIITNDGDVEWHGKPSEAADALVRTFQFTVEDKKGITKSARRRYYLRACQNILNKAETMEHEDFVAFLQKQVYNKERRVIMDSLKEE